MSGSLHTWYSLPDLDGFAERQVELTGEVELKRLSRLRDMLHADDGSVRVGVRFGPSRRGWVPMRVEYEATVRLICQRCLDPMDFEVAVVAKLGLIDNAAAESLLPEDYEAVLLEEDRFNPAQLLEDELLMALPLVPRHEKLEECGALARELDRLGQPGDARTKSVPPNSH
jgi:uncharacterized protein